MVGDERGELFDPVLGRTLQPALHRAIRDHAARWRSSMAFGSRPARSAALRAAAPGPARPGAAPPQAGNQPSARRPVIRIIRGP